MPKKKAPKINKSAMRSGAVRVSVKMPKSTKGMPMMKKMMMKMKPKKRG